MERLSQKPMNYLKTAFYGVHHYLAKAKRADRIRKYDQSTSFRVCPPFDSLPNSGWMVSSSSVLFKRSIAELIKLDPIFALPGPDKFGNSVARVFSVDLVNALLSSNLLVDIVKSYLGENARLDDMYLWRKEFSRQGIFDISEGWHTDNVGNRLKMFIGVDASSQAPSTILVENTHKKEYRIALVEISRFFGRIGEVPDQSNIAEITYEPDVVAMFDTNALHRGNYKATSMSRTCLVVEFIDREKSNFLSGACPCGPGQSRQGKIEFPIECADMLQSHPLIDERLLKKELRLVSYSIANMDAER